MNENQECMENYETISEEIKYITNSLVRLKILATLYEQPLNMKDINRTTGLSYSSISSNMFGLELGGFIYRSGNLYHISNTTELYVSNILELKDTINLFNKFFNILDAHIVDMIPEKSVAQLYLLGRAILVESNEKDVYRTYNIIPNTNELFKYVLDDQSIGAFAGLVLVRPDAQHTNSQQTNRNLCATRDARMYTQPQLEIYADDVKCSHGMTTGQLDENALFYMQSRGIPRDEARMLLSVAFTSDVIDYVRLDALKDRLHKLVEKRFRGELARCAGCRICK